MLALYEPSPPEVISQVQDALHRVQKSPSGWLIARDLLSHGDDKVKFFGALTIIIKLNTERFVVAASELSLNLSDILEAIVSTAMMQWSFSAISLHGFGIHCLMDQASW